MSRPLSFSICVPAFNEESNLKETVEDLISILSPFLQKLEVIIVDDGSTDSTPRLAEQLAREYCQVKAIHHKKNLGIGVCYRDALAIAEGNYYTWFPADYENSAEEFIQCLPYLSQETIVTCHHQEQDPRPVLRRWISHSYTWILNKYFHLNLKYYNGLTIFPVSILRSIPLTADGFVFSAESLICAIQRGYEILELSAPLRKRTFGRSKTLTFVSICQILTNLFHIFKLKFVDNEKTKCL